MPDTRHERCLAVSMAFVGMKIHHVSQSVLRPGSAGVMPDTRHERCVAVSVAFVGVI